MASGTFSPFDVACMKRALALAQRARNVSPNPRVGCVLARRGRVVGEGWHVRFGGPHAEAVALARAGLRARGATAYVTLEPCCHENKKTPPCAQALIRAGVRRAVVATRDPNPRVNGRGFARLLSAKVAVETGLLAREAERQNRPFVVRMTKRRPYVILKAALTLDGRMRTSGGQSKWITSEAARLDARRLRARVDAVLVGIGTVLADDPALTARGSGPDPMRIVLDSRLRIPRGARVLDGAAPTLVATARPSPAAVKALARSSAFLELPDSRRRRVDIPSLLDHLLRLGVDTLLVEGGPTVHTAFLEQGLVDELRLYVAPKLVGGVDAPSFFGGRGLRKIEGAIAVTGLSAGRIGPDLVLSGFLN